MKIHTETVYTFELPSGLVLRMTNADPEDIEFLKGRENLASILVEYRESLERIAELEAMDSVSLVVKQMMRIEQLEESNENLRCLLLTRGYDTV